MSSYLEMREKYLKGNTQTGSKPQSKNTPSKSGSGTSYLEMRKKYLNGSGAGNQCGSGDQVDADYINSYFTQANDFLSGANEALSGMTYQNAGATYDAQSQRLEELKKQSAAVSGYLNENRYKMDVSSAKQMEDMLRELDRAYGDAMSAFTNNRDYYAQWETEEDYNSYLDYQKDQDEKSKYDVQGGRREIEELEKELADLKLRQTGASFGPTANRDNAAAQYTQRIRELEQQITQKKQYANLAQRVQDRQKLEGAAQNADFGAKSGYVSTIDPNAAWGKSGVGDPLYEWINNRNGFRDSYEQNLNKVSSMSGNYTGPEESAYYQRGLDRMTEGEVALYNYYYTTAGREKAEEYLNSIQEDLSARKATEFSRQVAGKTGLELMFGVEAGLDQFQSGMASLLNGKDSYIAPTWKQIASGMVREDLADDTIPMWYNFKDKEWEDHIMGYSGGQAAYDAIVTSANMAPSILTSVAVGMINPVAGEWTGAALLGASAAGNAYQQKLNEGYDKDQARSYGILVGASEALLEKLLGGISKLGGNAISKYILKNLTAVDNALARFARTMGGQLLMSSASEGIEEGVQSILEPYLWQAITGEAGEVDLEEAAYSALLGFATGGIFEGPDLVMQNVQTKRMYGQNQKELVAKALETDPDNAYAKRLQKLLDSGKDLNGNQLRQLIEQDESIVEGLDSPEAQSGAKTEVQSQIEEVIVPAQNEAQQVAAQAETTGNTDINAQRNEAQEAKAEPVAETKQGKRAVAENATVAETEDQQVGGKEATTKATEAAEAAEVQIATKTIEEASKAYGQQAKAMLHTYKAWQDVAKFDAAYRMAYDMGRSGVALEYVKKSENTAYLTNEQKELAYEAGQASANAKAIAKDAANKALANGKAGRKKGGMVRGEGVRIADIGSRQYKILSNIAQVTGIDIVLYKSETDENGNFIGTNGAFDPKKPNELRIDIYAGLNNIDDVGQFRKYVMLRTFSHEFTHFIEKWNPIQYNEFRRAVFDTMIQRGTDIDRLITLEMEKNPSLSYEAASREVVAEAMVDVLPDSQFVELLANKHKTIFQKLLEKLEAFAADVRAYYDELVHDPHNKAAKAMKEEIGDTVRYVESIAKMWDEIAVQAVENYQSTVATDEVAVPKKEKTTSETKVETTVEEKAAEVEETAPVVTKSDYGYTISDNAEFGSLEISFEGKPSEAVRDALKQNKFRWHNTKKVWYGKTDRQTITDALNKVYETEAKPATEKTAMETLREMGAKPVGKNMLDVTDLMFPELKQKETAKDLYTEVEQALQQLNSFRSGGFEFSVTHIPGAGYDAKIKRVSDGYVSNARGLIFSGMFAGRQEAVADLVAVARNNKLLGAAENTKEVTNDVESQTGSDAQGVHEPVRRSEGSARLLEGVEPDAVQRGGEGRQPVRTGVEQGTADAGRDRQPDPAGDALLRSTGDRVGGDLQQLPAVNEDVTDNNVGNKEEADARAYATEKGYRIAINEQAARKHMVQVDIYDKQNLPTFNPVIINEASDWHKVKEAIDTREAAEKAKAEQLHAEVEKAVEEKSTVNPKGSNFVIGDSLNLPNGAKARVRANIDAIRLVKQIEAENRIATPAEQEVLSKYVGWGGLADAFGKPVSNMQTRKLEYEAVKGLEAEFAELKEVLTEEEYKSARESTKNAHYTSIEVIKAMYDGLKQLGFAGGRMLEPSSGVGNFVGAMPANMTEQVKSWTMVELDHITGLFAKHLYPNADVRIQGFEQTNIPDGYMDVAIGNVPFGKYGVTDKHYPKEITGAIHNYFFAKALHKVRTGGIVMFITSSYTMNGQDGAIRKYMMQRADLLGAIRLPNTAFAGNAGTSVVTDILVLKKRPERTQYAGMDFEKSNWERLSETGWEGAYVNEYFVQHPEMVLGTAKLTRGMYHNNELTVEPYTDKGSLGDQIREAFKNINGKMDYAPQLSPEKSNFRQEAAKKRQQKLIVKDGQIQARDENGVLTTVETDKDTAARISGMVAIRDAHTALCDALQQGVKKSEATKLRKALNKAYDSFVEQYGYLNAPKNKKAINSFTDRYAIQSLENYTVEGKKITATKADIFTKDTIAANRTQASAENVEEGLTISLNTTGMVDTDLIGRLTGQKPETVARQMIDQRLVFKDKDGNLIPAAQYLSGNVRAKLREMEGLTGIDKDYQNNVEALREVVPETVKHTDIYVNPGANWVPASVYEDFVGYILKRSNYTGWRTGKKDFSVEYVEETNEYKVSINDAYAKASAQNTQVWGEGGKAFSTIFENMLNGRRTNVYTDGPDGKRVIDRVKTEAVAEKAEKLNEEFRKWLWEDETRRTEMEKLYNETYNALVTPKYSGASLTVNGLNSTYELRPHQKDAVARIINSGGNTLLAHRVGAGKTMEMAAAAMKLKQLGIIKKPMFVVPNNVVAQWGKEFKDYFPAANILMVGDEDMTPAERMTTINRIKNNDYDAVILAYTKFEKIQMTTAWRQKFYEEQIDSLLFAINAEKESQGGKGFSVKQLETKRKQLESKVKKLTDKAKDEDGAMFEDLGVDSLFVDEAHNFKNLEYSTRMNNVSGLGKADGSQRAFDLYTKVRYLQQLNGGRGVVFATATPVMNSMTEMYIMQKYLQPDTLKQLGIEHFDSWAKMFGEVVNALEIAPSGSGYRLKQTFSKFKNVKALQQLFRSFTDVMTEVPGLKIPKMKGRKVQIVECEQGEFQKNYMAELAERASNVKNVDPSEDNMLKITSDGRKISYSQRMIDPSLPYEENGKIYKCCENVYRVYEESKKTKGTQMIFCDMATPKGKSGTKAEADTDSDEFGAMDVESAQLYDDIKARLVELGIPAKEIAFIHDAKNDKQKAALSEKMNNGTIRVLIGSTGKMGVGLNAQKKAVAIHHLDAPWRPGDIEQRDGRVFRQKNENEEAYKFVYVTKGSFDSRLWDILERKQKFINQVMNGEDVGNEIEDTGEVTLSAAEVKAVASDNPLIMEQVALEREISKLQSLQQSHQANVSRAKEKIVADRRSIASLEDRIGSALEDMKNRKDTYSSDKVFAMKLGKTNYTDKKEAGLALVADAQAKATADGYTDIGSFAGFTLRVVKTSEGIKGMVVGSGNYEFKLYPTNPTFGINHLISVVEGLEEKVAFWNKRLNEAKSDLQTQNEIVAAPFEQEKKLREKRARYNEVMDILNPPKEEQSLDTDGGDAVQYQQRKRNDDQPKKRKKATYNESETLFMIWENGSAPVGEVRRFVRFGKIRYFEKTEDGSVEISKSQYNERNDRNAEKTYGRIQRQVNGAADSDESTKRNMSGSLDSNRNTGRITPVSGKTFGEELRNDSGRGLSGSGRDNRGTAVTDLDEIQHQQRSQSLTDWEVMDLAYNELIATQLPESVREVLPVMRERLDKLNELQQQRIEQGRKYREQQFGTKVDRKAAEKTLARMKVLDDQIQKAEDDVLNVADKQVLKQVLQKARKVVEKQQWEKDEAKLKRYRDRRNNADAIKKYRTRLQKDVTELTDWVLHPNNKDVTKHIPETLKSAVIPFLSSIDFSSQRLLRGGAVTKADEQFMKRLKGLKAAMTPEKNAQSLYEGYDDLPPDFMERLQRLIDAAETIVKSNSGEFVVNQMSSDELRELSRVVANLKAYLKEFNKFHYNAMFRHVSDAGDNAIESMAQMKDAGEKTGAVSNFLLWQQIRPAYAFERFGEGGKAIYDGFRRGQATMAFNTKKIMAFAEKAYTAEEVQAWEKEIKTIELDGSIIRMPVSTIMSFYELSKRPYALNHILGQGVRVATFTADGKKIADNGHKITADDLATIIDQLTDRQKEVADALQKFMQEQGGKWGNYVSMKRFGEELFGEEHYFPINSDGRFLTANADESPANASLYALLNMSFTKAVNEEAKNQIILYSIFDVFSNHMASMAQYNAFALPVLDAVKWFNYQQKSEPDENGERHVLDSVRNQMNRVYGAPEESRPGSGRRGYAETFVLNILKAFNGTEAQGTPNDVWGLSTLQRYNRAQVAYNFRVVVQQPLAITRAALLVDYDSILRGMKLKPAAIQKNIEEMQTYSGIAAWKSLGFYDVNISRGLTQMIKQNQTVGDKITEAGMWGAEKADLLAWAGIWSACKEDVIKKQGLTPKDPKFFEENNFVGRGIGGQTSSEMLVRFRRDVIDLNPKCVVILSGTNDIAQNNGYIKPENTLGNIISMCELAKANGIKVILCSITPTSVFGWRREVNPVPLIAELNKMIEAYAKENGIYYLNYHPALTDEKGGIPAKWSNDTCHPNLECYRTVMEPMVCEAIDKVLKTPKKKAHKAIPFTK